VEGHLAWRRAHTLHERGIALTDDGRLADAAEAYREAVALRPDEADSVTAESERLVVLEFEGRMQSGERVSGTVRCGDVTTL
jgi:hypothetical protein